MIMIMKKIVLCLVLMSSLSTVIAQTKKPVAKIAKISVDKEFDFGETYRIFSITQANFDQTKAKFVKHFGKPVKSTISIMQWNKINIPEVGENLTITLQDGIFESGPGDPSYMTFGDKAMKAKALQNTSATKFRMMRLKVTNSENINVIRNNALEDAMMDLLLKKLI
jgi:hypothetical protein